MRELQVVVFRLNNELCCADTSQIEGIVKYDTVTSIPEAPDYIEGISNLRGKVVPIINLNRKFGMGQTEITKKSKIILTNINENLIGFIVNDVLEIIKLGEDDIEVTPEIISKTGNSYIKGVGKKGSSLISIIDLKKILISDEVEICSVISGQ